MAGPAGTGPPTALSLGWSHPLPSPKSCSASRPGQSLAEKQSSPQPSEPGGGGRGWGCPLRAAQSPCPSPALLAGRGARGPAAGTSQHLLFLAAPAGKWKAAEEFCLLQPGRGPDIWAAAERGPPVGPGPLPLPVATPVGALSVAVLSPAVLAMAPRGGGTAGHPRAGATGRGTACGYVRGVCVCDGRAGEQRGAAGGGVSPEGGSPKGACVCVWGGAHRAHRARAGALQVLAGAHVFARVCACVPPPQTHIHTHTHIHTPPPTPGRAVPGRPPPPPRPVGAAPPPSGSGRGRAGPGRAAPSPRWVPPPGRDGTGEGTGEGNGAGGGKGLSRRDSPGRRRRGRARLRPGGAAPVGAPRVGAGPGRATCSAPQPGGAPPPLAPRKGAEMGKLRYGRGTRLLPPPSVLAPSPRGSSEPSRGACLSFPRVGAGGALTEPVTFGV